MIHRKGVLPVLFLTCLLMASLAGAATLDVDQNDGGCSDVLGTPYCTIQAAVVAALAGDTVSVAPGTYVENVLINKNLALVSTGGRVVTTIQGITGAGALGTVQVEGTTTAVDVGGPGAGFRIEGIDNGFPGVENAAIYFRGTHSNARIRDNDVVAQGEAGLLSEYGATISGFLVDGNTFSGQTFLGAVPADCGFGNQFTTPNVPRQLVTMGGGSGGGNTSSTTFTNNLITGAAGGGSGGACTPPLEQGNTLVTVDSNGATISGNTFAGTTGRFATSLRSRGPSTAISGNAFASGGLRPIACHVFIQNTGSDVGTVAAANTFDSNLLFSPDDPLAVVATICPAPPCADPGDVDYGGFTASDCASSVVKAKNQGQLDAYLADFGVGGGTKPKHLNVLFNPAGPNVDIVSPCRIKLLGLSKLVAIAADRVCLFGQAGVTVGAGTPAAGSGIDVEAGPILMVSEEGKVETEQGISYIAGEMTLEAADDAGIGSGSTVDVLGSLSVTSSAGRALIEPGALVMVDELTMTAAQQVRIQDNADVDVATGDLTMTSAASAAEIQAGALVTVAGNLAMSGLTCQIGASATVGVTGTATLAAAGSATASDASILSNAALAAADVSQTAEHKAVLSGGATVDATGNALIDAPVCVINGTVTAATTSGACLP